MTYTSDRRQLADALKTVAPAIPKTGMPILSGVRIRDGHITATDLDLTIKTEVDDLDLDVDLVVNHHLLTRALAAFTGDHVTLDIDDGQVRLASGTANVTLLTMPASEWPLLNGHGDGDTFDLSATDVETLRRVAPAASEDMNRLALTGLHFDSTTVGATNSYWLAQADLTVELPDTLVPAATVLRAVDKAENGMTMRIGADRVEFTHSGTTWSTRLLTPDQPYPPFDRLVTMPAYALEVDREELLDVLRRLMAFGSGGNPEAPRLWVEGGQLQVRRRFHDVGEISDSVDCSGEFCDEAMTLRGDYLIPALDGAREPTVTLRTSERLKPMRVDGSNGYLAVVMPIR